MQFIGALNWAGFIPRDEENGVRGQRCGFGWSMRAALANFGPHAPGQACDARGAVLPFPYGIGAGYVMSAALVKWLASAPSVLRWVSEAAGATRNTLQWQKYEDTTTGYWLTYAPEKVRYTDIARVVHDMACHRDGESKRRRGGVYRPPANDSLMVHNLKAPRAFSFVWYHLAPASPPYEHEECLAHI